MHYVVMSKLIIPYLPATTLLAVMASLAACGGGETDNAVQPVDEMAGQNGAISIPVSESDVPSPAESGEVEGDEQGESGATGDGTNALPPPGAFRFVGMWAAEADMCDGQAWRFTRESMETPAGSVCKFVNATPVAGGYDISARCVAEGPPVDDMLNIRFAESAQAMLFEAENIADAGLIYCGPPED